MASDEILSESQLAEILKKDLAGWEIQDGWLKRTFNTPGWPHTMMLVQTIGYLAEAAYHHPDLKVGYAKVTVLLQTHKVKGLTRHDTELAARITEIALWKPPAGSALEGYPKKWVS